MTFACQDPICSPGQNLFCWLRSSKIICGQIWEGNWYGSKWQMTAATELSANVCERVCVSKERVCLFKCFLYMCPRACARTFPVVGDPSSGSYYKAAGILGQFRLTDEKKTKDGSYVNNRRGLCWHLPASNPHPLTPLAPFCTLYQPDVTPGHICHSRDPSPGCVSQILIHLFCWVSFKVRLQFSC